LEAMETHDIHFIMYIIKFVLWNVHPLLGNDREISSHRVAFAKEWFCKQQSLLGNGHNIHECSNREAAGSGVLCAVRFEMLYGTESNLLLVG
jgi:hypothetical protein